MVAPGTGIAVFKAIIEEFKDTPNLQMILIFGCRSKEKDDYFAEELAKISNLKRLVAYSRDDPGSGKDYVQHVIEREKKLLQAELVTN